MLMLQLIEIIQSCM